MQEVFIFILNFLGQALNILNIEIVDYNGVTLTYLDILLACLFVPLLISFLRGTFNETNSLHDFSLLRSTKELAYNNFSNYKPRHAKKK